MIYNHLAISECIIALYWTETVYPAVLLEPLLQLTMNEEAVLLSLPVLLKS